MPLFFVFKLRSEEFRNLALRTQQITGKLLISRLYLSSAIFLWRPCQTEHAAACSRIGIARQADYAWVVLARVLAVALDRGWIDVNPCEKGGRLYNQSRRDRIWTLEDEIAFLGEKISPTE